MKKIKFRNRSMTDLIIVADIDLQNKEGDELYSDARRRGDFDVDYHFGITIGPEANSLFTQFLVLTIPKSGLCECCC